MSESLSIVWCGLGVSVAPSFEPSTSGNWISNATTSTASTAAATATAKRTSADAVSTTAATADYSDNSVTVPADPGDGERRHESEHHV